MLKTYVINLGAGKAGLTDLRAQLVDSDGVNSGAAISSGFVDIGSGQYEFTDDIPDGFRGAVQFYSNSNPSLKYCAIAINNPIGSTSSDDPDTVNAYIYVRNGVTPITDAKLYYQQIASNGGGFEDDEIFVSSDDTGLAQFQAVVGGTYRCRLNNGRFKTFVIDGETDPLPLVGLVA